VVGIEDRGGKEMVLELLGLLSPRRITDKRYMIHMPPLQDAENRMWRTDFKRGRGVYALISNDVEKPSEYDPLVGVMESMELAENIVDLHNKALTMFGRGYLKRMEENDG
jgi:hypothetical protein